LGFPFRPYRLSSLGRRRLSPFVCAELQTPKLARVRGRISLSLAPQWRSYSVALCSPQQDEQEDSTDGDFGPTIIVAKGGAGAGSNPGAAAGTPAQDARQHSSLGYINHILSSLDFLSGYYYQPWRGTLSSICHLVLCQGRLGSPVVCIIARCCFLVAHPARTGCFTSENRNSCVMDGQDMSNSVTEEEAQAVWHHHWRVILLFSRDIHPCGLTFCLHFFLRTSSRKTL
jgi:hypothetical protein